MARYHISPETGRPNLCRASIQQCPINKGEDEHYDTKEEARAAAKNKLEKQYNNSVVSSARKKESTMSTKSPLEEKIYSMSVNNVDDFLAEKHYELYKHRSKIRDMTNLIRKMDNRSSRFKYMNEINRKYYEEEIEKSKNEISELSKEVEPYEKRYSEQQWDRAFLVTNKNGHVHKSMHCSTCTPTTEFEWKTELSGKSEEEIVKLAGERACTVCYPDAPVSVTSNPTKIYGKNELTPEQKQAKEAKKKKEQFVLINPKTGEEIKNDYGGKFKTQRGAELEALDNVKTLFLYGTSHPHAEKWHKQIKNISLGIAVMTDREPKEIYDEFFDKGRKGFKRSYKGMEEQIDPKDFQWAEEE